MISGRKPKRVTVLQTKCVGPISSLTSGGPTPKISASTPQKSRPVSASAATRSSLAMSKVLFQISCRSSSPPARQSERRPPPNPTPSERPYLMLSSWPTSSLRTPYTVSSAPLLSRFVSNIWQHPSQHMVASKSCSRRQL